MSEDVDEVWSATVDDETFKVLVVRNPEATHNGVLTITHIESDTTFFTQDVGLSYGAVFGPDVSDVAAWQVTSLDAIDEWIEEQKHLGEERGSVPPA